MKHRALTQFPTRAKAEKAAETTRASINEPVPVVTFSDLADRTMHGVEGCLDHHRLKDCEEEEAMKIIEQKLHIRRRPEGTTMQRLIRSVRSSNPAIVLGVAGAVIFLLSLFVEADHMRYIVGSLSLILLSGFIYNKLKKPGLNSR